MSARVKDVDKGLGAFMRRLAELEEPLPMTVGIHEEEGSERHAPGNASIAEIGGFLELGTSETSAEPWLRPVIDAEGSLGRELADAGADVLRGSSVSEAFGQVAAKLAGRMRDAAPVSSGQVRDAITARVRGEKVA